MAFSVSLKCLKLVDLQALADTDAAIMIRTLLHFSARVDGMRKFVMINTLGVIKITKKHDKQPGVKTQMQVFV